MKDKKELIYDLAVALVAILFGCVVVIMIIVNIPGTKEIDGALIANVLTGGVTLFAPIAAYYLLTDWKEQLKYSKKVDFILDIRKEIRDLNNEIFMLRNYFPLDIENPNHYLNLESANEEYQNSMSRFIKHLNEIEDLFEDLNFLLNTKDSNRNKIKKQLNVLRSFEGLSRSAHREIYNAMINGKNIVTDFWKASKFDKTYTTTYDARMRVTDQGQQVWNKPGLVEYE